MHVVITGASSGIGRALALEYGRAGAVLTLVARREALLLELQREIGRSCHVVSRDLSKQDQITDWISAAEAANGPIDILVNNAGVLDLAATVQLPVEIGQRMLDVCLTAPLRLSRAVLPGMIARKSGTIVQVASMASFVTPPGGTWYGAAKAGLAAFSEALRTELRGSGVNVLTVYPGPVATPLADGGYASYGESRVLSLMPEGTPDELARRMRRAVDRRSRRLVYPRAYGLARVFPGISRWFTAAFPPELKPYAPLVAPAEAASPPLTKSPIAPPSKVFSGASSEGAERARVSP